MEPLSDSGSDCELATFDFAKMEEMMGKSKKEAKTSKELPKLPNQDEMSAEELDQALKVAQLTENTPQCLSLVNSLVPKVSGAQKLDLLERQY